MSLARERDVVQVPASPPTVEVRRASSEDLAALATFFREAWNSQSSAQSVENAWRTGEAHNGYPPLIVIALLNGRVIAYCGTIPIALWRDGAEHPAHWLKGLMVLPEVQKGPLGFHVLKKLSTLVGESGGIAVAEPAIRLFAALGYKDLGPLHDLLLPLRPGRIMRLLPPEMTADRGPMIALAARTVRLPLVSVVAGLSASLLLGIDRVRRRAGQAKPSNMSIEFGKQIAAAELQELWLRTRPELQVASARGVDYLSRRYGVTEAVSSATYTPVTVRIAGRLVGVAAVRRPNDKGDPRLGGIRVATLSDALFSPASPEVGVALATGAARAGRTMEADAILAAASHPTFFNALAVSGYLPVSSRLHVLWRGENKSADPRPLSDWWLCRGDCEADDTF